MKPASHSKVLITGIDGFTGRFLQSRLIELGFEVVGLTADLTDRQAVLEEVTLLCPDYVLHLAAISFAAEADLEAIYKVNVIGSINLLDALSLLNNDLQKVILAGSAAVYGNRVESVLSEDLCPHPVNHYGCSKLTMEHMAQNYMEKLPILITRPFNYTGIGHADHFLIPKIVKAYQQNLTTLELGNLDVSREFNDIRDICELYIALLTCSTSSVTVNLCSGKTTSLIDVIDMMNSITGQDMKVTVNPNFVRPNEIKDLSGSTEKLSSIIPIKFDYHLQDTLKWMYEGNS